MKDVEKRLTEFLSRRSNTFPFRTFGLIRVTQKQFSFWAREKNTKTGCCRSVLHLLLLFCQSFFLSFLQAAAAAATTSAAEAEAASRRWRQRRRRRRRAAPNTYLWGVTLTRTSRMKFLWPGSSAACLPDADSKVFDDHTRPSPAILIRTKTGYIKSFSDDNILPRSSLVDWKRAISVESTQW